MINLHKKRNILLVDDSKTVNFYIKEILIDNGCLVDSAFSVKETKDKLSKNSYDFVILDLVLPDGNGKDLIYLIPKNRTKIMVLTSSDDVKLREHFFQIGVLDYFSKNNPLDYIASEILTLIKKLENNHKYKILLIEKNIIIKNMIENIFSLRNYKILSAESANEGLYKLKHQEINLVILNLKLSDMKAEDILYEIRKNRDFMELPIVGITSKFLDSYLSA